MLIILLPHHFKFPVLYTRISPQGGTSTLEDLLLIWRVTSSWGFEELLLLSSLSLFISSSWVPPSMLEDLLLAWSLPLFSSSSSWADPSLKISCLSGVFQSSPSFMACRLQSRCSWKSDKIIWDKLLSCYRMHSRWTFHLSLQSF